MGISLKHHINNTTIAINETKALELSGQYSNTVGVLYNGSYLSYLPLGGVIDAAQAKAHRLIEIANICEFYWDELTQSTPYIIPVGHITVGALIGNKCYIAIKNDKPIHYSPSRRRAK